MVAAIAGMLCVAAAMPFAARRLGREAGYVLAAAFVLAGVSLVGTAAAAVRGAIVEQQVAWLPSAGLAASLRMDGLSVLFVTLVLVIGAVVAAYAARYLSASGDHGRLLGWLAFFAMSMLGLVLADDLIMLVVFWELTSISSFMLIAGRGDHRGPATRALVVTTAGGLALLAAAAMITGATGVTRFGDLLADPGVLRNSGVAPVVIALLILAAATKSAQVPFHFWLPGAMVAPTPISTYLHAATMVKAGIYLLLRFSPVFGGVGAWQATLVTLGLATALWGAVLAVKHFDLKAILAYSTMSQLGLMVALTGLGTPYAITAVGVLLLAHGAYKATLFMVAGIVDHQTGTRDIRALSGLRSTMPATTAVAALATLSMAGIPPLLGFVAKEEALGAALGWEAATPAVGAVALAVAASSALTVTYSIRLYFETFGGSTRTPASQPSFELLAPAILTAAAGVVLGFGVSVLQPVVDAAVGTLSDSLPDHSLALWHGFTVELALSTIIILSGVGLYAARRKAVVRRALDWSLPQSASGVDVYDRVYDAVLRGGALVARSATARSPSSYVASIFLTAVVAGLAFALAAGPVVTEPPAVGRPGDWVIVGLVTATLAALTVVRHRLTAAMLLGVVGYLIVLWFAVLGAADLAMTVLLVETLFVTAIVLSLRALPDPLLAQSPRQSLPSAALASGVGVAAGAATWWLTGRRGLSEPGQFFLERADELAGGSNVVNTILVDFRALDTLGEITVVLAAITGLAIVAGRGQDASDGSEPS